MYTKEQELFKVCIQEQVYVKGSNRKMAMEKLKKWVQDSKIKPWLDHRHITKTKTHVSNILNTTYGENCVSSLVQASL